ncbi:hypothetical protein [Aureispira anguillae]|uniref:Uncharacterized protein n=1 Tax=Aureispira anguillae TaxID=2864201 RepID=A0A915YGH8_9BACT|nr:hypothetical protein [Aureispira anguillae]BDS12589.1 hypothetical protein AsAng_0033130 [Aureispira anguillae]
MFGKVKKWFGIEGTKIRLHVLPTYPHDVETINGEIEVYSKRPEKVLAIKLKFIEVYTRGRGEEKRIDEYLLGTWEYNKAIEVSDGNSQMLFFKLEFNPVESAMDKRASKGPMRRGLVRLMKSMKGVQSDYRIEAEAIVEGGAWNPITKAKIIFD